MPEGGNGRMMVPQPLLSPFLLPLFVLLHTGSPKSKQHFHLCVFMPGTLCPAAHPYTCLRLACLSCVVRALCSSPKRSSRCRFTCALACSLPMRLGRKVCAFAKTCIPTPYLFSPSNPPCRNFTIIPLDSQKLPAGLCMSVASDRDQISASASRARAAKICRLPTCTFWGSFLASSALTRPSSFSSTLPARPLHHATTCWARTWAARASTEHPQGQESTFGLAHTAS